MTLDRTLAAIDSGPRGAEIAAIFDFGGTVIDGFRPRRWYRRLFGRRDPADALLDGIRSGPTDGEYSRFLQRISREWAGVPEAELDERGLRVFRKVGYGHLFPEAWRLIRAHAAAGHTLVLASSLTRFQVAPAAAELGIDHVLYTSMASTDGVLTGFVHGKTLWRNGKADAVRAFAAANGIDLSRSYAYADGLADLPLLALVGNPVTVNPDPRLEPLAAQQSWPTLGFAPRQAPRAGDYLRTCAGFCALLAGALFGVLSRSATRSRRKMADALMAYGTAATLRSLGVRVTVVGKNYAAAPRPAVFLFNHQSQFDVIVLPYVLGGGVTGIGKQELTRNPVFGPLMRFVGVTFIDRADTASAKAKLAPVVETLRGGLSIAIAPEGTRSYTPRVGPFKKGAFHIAIQAGVPVIPVVIRNVGEIAWRNSMIARRGTVEVTFLDPIDVGDWDPERMDDRIAAVRQRVEDTLVHWPQQDSA